jgi:indolepyruvate ferredoxin oxidoreductase
LIPLPLEAIDRAIELNGASVAMNRRAFAWGRFQAHDPAQIEALLDEPVAPAQQTPDDVIADRRRRLVAYQNEAYALRFQHTIDAVRAAEARAGGDGRLTEAVAKSLYKLMAYKDEYEVARLHTETTFRNDISAQFDGAARITYSFAPPLFARRDPVNGHLLKRRYGPWMYLALGLLAKGRRLRGTRFDPFGYLADRKLERRLIEDFEAAIHTLVAALNGDTLSDAVVIAELPMAIKGYGHVKDRSICPYRERLATLTAQFGIAGDQVRAA